MKKTIRLLAYVSMLSGLFLVACNKDDSSYNPTPSPDPTPNPSSENWIDLGLPSGLLWAECNIGATTPEGYGDYFAWGETSTKETYAWNNYKYSNGMYYELTKYCNKSSYGYNGYTDDLTILQPADDVATQELGNGARIPTKEEWEELRDNTSSKWTTQNGVKGYLFTASNGQHLFLPAAGYRPYERLDYEGANGFYWSASLNENSPDEAWYIVLGSSSHNMSNSGYRQNGVTVRAVRASQK